MKLTVGTFFSMDGVMRRREAPRRTAAVGSGTGMGGSVL